MRPKIGCASCQFNATMIVGSKALCYFCARQTIFDLVRGSGRVFFQDGGTVGGFKAITFRTEKLGKKTTST